MSRSNQTSVENTLTMLWDRESSFEKAAMDDAEAEHAYKMQQARTFLAADGTEKARAAKSLVDSEALHLDHLKKKAVKEFTREKLKDAQSALSARQSILTAASRSDQNYANNKEIA